MAQAHEYHTEQGEKDILQYPSWDAFVHHAQTRTTTMWNTSECASRRENEKDHSSGGYWQGTATFQEAVDVALKGWPEGLQKVKALSKVLIDRVTSLVERHTLDYGVTGMDFDMGMYLQGVPEHWYTINTHIEQGEGKRVLRMVFNCVASAGISTEVIMAKGAAVAALIESLEFAGYRVELMLAQCVSYGWSWSGEKGEPNTGCYVYVPLKAADQPLDLDRLTFALAHPSTLRRFMFGVEESIPRFVSEAVPGYGSCCSIPKAMQGDINIEQSFLGQPQWKDTTSAVNWITQELQKQGVQMSTPEGTL